MVGPIKQPRQGAGRDPAGILLQLGNGRDRLRLDPCQRIGRERGLPDHVAEQRQAGNQVRRQRGGGHGRAVEAARRLDLDPQPLLRLREGLGVKRCGSLVQHAERQGLHAARGRIVGRVASIERQRQLGHRHGGALGIIDRDSVGEPGVGHVGEVERRQLADRRDFPLRPRHRGRLRRRHLVVRLELGFDVGRPLARLQLDRQGRAGQPLLHRRLHFGRRDSGIGRQRLFVEVAIMGEGLAFRQRDGLAAEIADLLERTDSSANLVQSRALHFGLGRPFGNILGNQLVEPFFHQRRVDARLHHRLDEEDPDPLQRVHPGRRRDSQLLVSHQRLVEP